jgi:hypothetical protein
MAVKINLLPADYALTGSLGQIVKAARPLSVILLALFLIAAAGMGGFFIFSSISLKNLTTGNSSLESQIQTQSAAQQQIILLEDRLGQIKKVQGIASATKNLNNVNPLLTLVTGSSLLSELDVDPQKTSASIVFKSNSDLTNFLKSLSSGGNYSSVSLGSFSYSPAMGYQVGLNFVGK